MLKILFYTYIGIGAVLLYLGARNLDTYLNAPPLRKFYYTVTYLFVWPFFAYLSYKLRKAINAQLAAMSDEEVHALLTRLQEVEKSEGS